MSSGVIVDANIVIKWVLRENDSPIARSLLSHWIKEQVVVLVPTLFTYEITNILYRKARQGEISLENAKLGITRILSTGLEIAHSEGLLTVVRFIYLLYTILIFYGPLMFLRLLRAISRPKGNGCPRLQDV